MKFHKRKEEVSNINDYNRADDYMLKSLVSMNRPDWLIDKNVKDLLKIYRSNLTYLDYILQEFLKNNNSVNISTININFKDTDIDDLASVYIIYARYDLVGYLPQLSPDVLLKSNGGKNLLETLISRNHMITINKILSESVLDNKDILVTLGLNHINLKRRLNIELMPDDIINACCEWYSNKYDKIVTDQYYEKKLYNLKRALSTRESDLNLVESIIKSYRVFYINNKDLANKELDNILNIFSNNPISIKYGNTTRYSQNSKKLTVSYNSIPMISHEFGHAVFSSLSKIAYSDEFEQVCKEVRNDKSVVNRLSKLTQIYYESSNKLKNSVNESWNRQKYIKQKDEKDIVEFINKTKEMQRTSLKSRGYDPVIVDKLVNFIYTKEEYMKSFENTKKRELTVALFRTEYCHILCMADIIDAVYKGNFYDDKIRTEDYKVIKGCAGHGLYYYNSVRENSFNEVMANYSQLLKSFYYEDCMKLLTEILGEKFVSTMKRIYNEQVINRNIERKSL